EIRTALAKGQGYGDAAHERRRVRLVEAERFRRNREGGYWIAADDPTATEHALTTRHAIGRMFPRVRRVLMMSDGVERAASLLARSCVLGDRVPCQPPGDCHRRLERAGIRSARPSRTGRLTPVETVTDAEATGWPAGTRSAGCRFRPGRGSTAA